ncbi:hypothetical protein TRIUR3_33294 [Triticum urartu]|uniref:Uncharacterized protein n=1 Tax=Triticum urartu TaxID=4572 RepID=M8AFJ2_TRIUA|nr:hypothetical protein TRIUR3_33294 [Triticum urartu]
MAPTGRVGDEASVKEELGGEEPRKQRSSELGSMATAAGDGGSRGGGRAGGS